MPAGAVPAAARKRSGRLNRSNNNVHLLVKVNLFGQICFSKNKPGLNNGYQG
jgi:hypothetical protein